MEITVFKGKAAYGRSAYLKLIDDKVVFDCSDKEYELKNKLENEN